MLRPTPKPYSRLPWPRPGAATTACMREPPETYRSGTVSTSAWRPIEIERHRPASERGVLMHDAPALQPLAATTREAAQMLRVSQRTLWGLTAPRGPIPSFRHDGKTRGPVHYRVIDLKTYLAGIVETPTESPPPTP